MRISAAIPFIPLLLALCACGELPAVDGDVARAQASADPRGRLELLRRQGEETAGEPFVPGNSVHLLRDGPASYAAMRQAILGARRCVEMESYTFDQGEARAFADLLLETRRRGVDVHLIYDAWGSIGAPAALFDTLRAAGVQVLEFSPIDPGAVVENLVDRRDHRKLLVVDGRVAITGGVNVSDVYLRRSAAAGHDGAPWRDTDIRVEGPVVAEYQKRFRQTWEQQKGPILHQALADPPAPAAGDLQVQVVANTPAAKEHTVYRGLLVALALARHSARLTTGFFAPTPDLLEALRAAARRGVEVELLVPSRSTSDLAIKAGRSYYEDLLEDGVRIYEFQGRVLHAKTVVIDGDWSTVGSSNLDWRSVVFNNEINTVILSREFGGELEAMFHDDLGQAKAIDLASWKHRRFAERFNEWKARLFEVVL